MKQELKWSVPQEQLYNAGTLTTAGNLVFQGRPDGQLVAYHADDGEILWTFDLGLGISAPPITYKIDGRQYIALLVGWGGGWTGFFGADLGWPYGTHTRRLVVFSLEGESELPPLPAPQFATPIKDATFVIDASLAEMGAALYGPCQMCHGSGVIAGGMAPDLRASTIPLVPDAFASVVRDGSRSARAMPAFPHLTDENLTALRHYIRQQAVASSSIAVTQGGN